MDSGLVARLIYCHRIRNAAEGIAADTSFVSGLIDYGVRLQGEEAKTLAKAAFYQGVIDNARIRISALLEQADTADKRREILSEVVRLSDAAENAKQRLTEIANG